MTLLSFGDMFLLKIFGIIKYYFTIFQHRKPQLSSQPSICPKLSRFFKSKERTMDSSW